MKKLTLLLAVVVTLLVAFTTKSNPPSFVTDMENFTSFMEAKEVGLSEAISHQDSIAIIQEIDNKVYELKSKWELSNEQSKLPPMSYTVCRIRCGVSYAMCHEPNSTTIFVDCYFNYLLCLSMCGS